MTLEELQAKLAEIEIKLDYAINLLTVQLSQDEE